MISRLRPKIVAKVILTQLMKSEGTASAIGKVAGYNQRTVAKYLELLESFGFAEHKEIKLGSKIVKVYSVKEKEV